MRGRAMPQPPIHFLRDPFGLRGLGGREQDKVFGFSESLFNGSPKLGRDGEAGFVAKDTDGPQTVPGFGKLMQTELDGRGKLPISRVTVGDEGAVFHWRV